MLFFLLNINSSVDPILCVESCLQAHPQNGEKKNVVTPIVASIGSLLALSLSAISFLLWKVGRRTQGD